MKLILGSGSKWRREVLEKAGFAFDVISPDIDEKAIRTEDPKELVLALAHAKADAVLLKINEPAIVITADQVVFCNGQIFEKPSDAEEARMFLRTYCNHPMEIINSMVLTNAQTGKRVQGIDISKLYFKFIPEEVIEEAIAIGRIMSCAGAMRCQEKPLSDYLEKLEGTYESTSGMPLELLERLMKEI